MGNNRDQIKFTPPHHFTSPNPASLEKRAYLVGHPISHSLSPLLHHTVYSTIGKPWGQILYETTDLTSFVEHIRSDASFMGSGVTMPFKVSIVPFLDELTPEANAIGAINTIFLDIGTDGRRKYIGTNTDCLGIRDALVWNYAPTKAGTCKGKPALVVGGGGTTRAAVYALHKFLGCSPVYVVNRDEAEVKAVINECRGAGYGDDIVHVASVEQATALQTPSLIVSCVPDFAPLTVPEKAARAVLQHFLGRPEKGALLEMCYHPSPNTAIDGLARRTGWTVVPGTEAMIGQGLAQASLWTGIPLEELPREKAREAVRRVTRRERETKL